MTAVTLDRATIVYGNHPDEALPLVRDGLAPENVFKATGQMPALIDASLTVENAEVLALIGAPGAGKSTLLRAIHGLVCPAAGHVIVQTGDGPVNLTTASPAQKLRIRRHDIALVSTEPTALPWRNVAENVGLGLEFAGIDAKSRAARVGEVLDRFGLQAYADCLPKQLTPMLAVRMAIARAAASQAPILLLDDVFGGIPHELTDLAHMISLLKASSDTTIILAAGNSDHAFAVADRIAVLDAGRILQTDTPAAILSRPAHTAVRNLTSRINPFAILRAGDVMEPAIGIHGASIAPSAPIAEVIALVEKAGRPVAVARNGEILGQITRDSAMARLIAPHAP